MNSAYTTRLQTIRREMDRLGLDAFIVPSEDEYLGEYIPDYNRRLEWLSGFTGSAGMIIVMKAKAALFVDGRYTVQSRQQVSATDYQFLHLHEDPQAKWLSNELTAGQVVGFDPRMHTYQWYLDTKSILDDFNIELKGLSENPIDLSWHDRPAIEVKPSILMDHKWTGITSSEKRANMGNLIADKNADAAILFSAESCNWLLNIRGQDIPSLPIALGFGILYANGDMIFHINKNKLAVGINEHVGTGVTFLAEEDFEGSLKSLKNLRVLADFNTCNAYSMIHAVEYGANLIQQPDPVLLPKAAKSEIEIAGMREAHIQDAVAEIGFLHWFDQQVEQGLRLDEATLSEKLFDFRQQQPNFVEVSFNTISAAGSNAAMCHYNHLNGTPAVLPENGVYLVDSGGQYDCGTTDITRTLAVGNPDDDIKKNFTLVLKGHIALDLITFPEGTTGSQLDILARAPLWHSGLDYDHGTGHGVGHFMSVHEGPQRISKKGNDIALVPGMVLSNEPGYYKDGAYGIRCENLVVVQEAEGLGQDGKTFLQFDALTYVPFDLRLVLTDLLTEQERQWLNNYHLKVLTLMSPRVNQADLDWLKQATRAV